MRRRSGFVNSDPTRYCAFLLGQSQDVGNVETVEKVEPSHFPKLARCPASERWQVGGVFRHPPVVHRQGKAGECFLAAGRGRNEVAAVGSKWGATASLSETGTKTSKLARRCGRGGKCLPCVGSEMLSGWRAEPRCWPHCRRAVEQTPGSSLLALRPTASQNASLGRTQPLQGRRAAHNPLD